MSLPKPYYDDGKGIVIYCGTNRVSLPYGTKERLQANGRAYRKTKAIRGSSPQLARGRGVREGRAFTSIEGLCGSTLRNMRISEGRAAPPRCQHLKQQSRKYPVSLSQMSHEGGRAI